MKQILKLCIRPVITIGAALLIGALLIINSGENPFHAYGVLFKGAFGSVSGWLNTLSKATPLIFTGLAASIAALVGVFNIGIEGQLYVGGLAAAVAGAHFSNLPWFVLIPLCLFAAMAAACIWALVPGLLNSKLDINIFIMFFMLNNMAKLFTEYLANGPFKGNLPEIATGKIAPAGRLYRFSNYADLSVGFVLALLLVIVIWFVIKKTRFGYECAALGLNSSFSRYIGIRVTGTRLLVLMVSAMLAGLAGAEPIMGSLGRFYGNFSNNLGFTGISIGLLANNNPVGVVVFAIFFGALNSGGAQMAASTGVSGDLINVLQSLMIILISAEFTFRTFHKKEKTAKGGVPL